ncbi:MAG TPA: ABC transporter ATP-binding protein/permease [Firmicutes bacterium]|nr:ABC transporter ATP-binding protein/permease [Bacillota bacterium]
MADNRTSTTTTTTARRGPGMGGGRGRGGRMIIAKPKDFRGTFRKLLRFMRPHWMGMTAIILLAGATTLASSLSPKIMGSATNEIVRGAQSLLEGGSGVDFGLLTRILMLLMAAYVATSLLRYAQNYMMAGVSQRTMYDLRQAVDRKLSRLPLEYYDTHAYGDILSRVTNDVDTVSDSLQSSIISAFRSALSVVITLVMMLTISPRLTLIGLVTVPITLWFSSTVVKKTQRFFKGQQSAMGRLSGYIEEMYTAHSIIKAYSGEEDACRQFSEINRELRDYGRKAQFISGVLSPIVGFIGNAGYVLVTVVGAMMILGGELLVGDLQAFIRYLRQLSDPINETVSIVNVLQSTVAAAERIFEVLDADEEIPEREPPVIPPESRGAVEITDVHFGYEPGIEVIRGLDVSVQPGEQVALVGETGAGKTTIVNLIMRFYDVTQGSIKVDGVDIRDMPREVLRERFGMVLQDTWLFHGTILENIRYGRLDATDEEVRQAARLAYADGFIAQLPGGYDFVLGEDALNLSQGQRQLLTIARAILSDPEILILDEATSSVDTRTEVLIQKAMKNLMKGRTVFVIAHRLSTIRDSSVILMLENGQVLERGTHAELLAQNGAYARLYNSQFELENGAAV